jgi:hypothetical protein
MLCIDMKRGNEKIQLRVIAPTRKGPTWTTIDLCEHNDHVNSKADAKMQVLLSHMSWVVTTVHKNECIVGHTRGNTVDTVDKEQIV